MILCVLNPSKVKYSVPPPKNAPQCIKMNGVDLVPPFSSRVVVSHIGQKCRRQFDCWLMIIKTSYLKGNRVIFTSVFTQIFICNF